MTGSGIFRNEIHAKTWHDIMSGIENVLTVNNVIEGRGRAEGYVLGLFESDSINDLQRKQLAVQAFESALQRSSFLHKEGTY